MWIAHRYESTPIQSTRNNELPWVFELGCAHVDGDALHHAIANVEDKRLDARICKQSYLCLCCKGSLVEIFPDTPRGIAAHHRLRAVGIENTHTVVGLWDGRRANQHQSVAADALVAVTPKDGCLNGIGDGVLHGINVDIVVAAAVHLGEMDLTHLTI